MCTPNQGGTKQGGDSLDSTLERCVSLFGHMSDKDLFAQLYRDALSKRLLNKKSKCNDAERLVITRMKAEVRPFAYTL
jgi:cullin 1